MKRRTTQKQEETMMRTDERTYQETRSGGSGALPRDWVVVDEADGVLDELQAWYLGKVEREGWVYTSALRQLVNRMYRDRDYLAKRSKQGRQTAYDYAVQRDQVALSWAIRAIVRHVPAGEKRTPEPPKPARKPARRLTERQRPI